MDFCDKVFSMLGNSCVEFSIVDDVFNRLLSFGVSCCDDDVFIVGFSILKSVSYIKNYCGITVLPPELNCSIVDLCCGEILLSLKSSGKLDDSFALAETVSSVKIGDTSVSFDSSFSNCARLDTLINSLFSNCEVDFLCFRKLRW